jgi:ParD-like antitoxin of type II bacterial toxin-antitoxin system
MGLPIKISDTLALAARTEAETFERSIASQVEHWAQIGRAVEQVLGHDQVAALKKQAGMRELTDAMRTATSDTGPARVLAHLQKLGGPRYTLDPVRRGGIIRLEPDGSRTRGRFVRRRFVPVDVP